MVKSLVLYFRANQVRSIKMYFLTITLIHAGGRAIFLPHGARMTGKYDTTILLMRKIVMDFMTLVLIQVNQIILL